MLLSLILKDLAVMAIAVQPVMCNGDVILYVCGPVVGQLETSKKYSVSIFEWRILLSYLLIMIRHSKMNTLYVVCVE